ncbi:MAG: cupin [marine bacterium B5-7]|nr:MAG: cupin [marine bacterium B5-7]
MKPENIFDLVKGSLDEEQFETLVESDHVRIERIVSMGHTSPASGWYDQEQNEWVLVLKGSAIIALKSGQTVRLESGDHFNLPAHTHHKVEWTTPDTETIWLTVHY